MADHHYVSEQTRRRAGFFEDIVEFIATCLEKQGIQNAKKEAEEIALKLHEHWAGSTMYFPQKPRLFFDRLKKEAVASYKGYNISEVLRKYNISQSLLYKWMNELQEINKADNKQHQLDI